LKTVNRSYLNVLPALAILAVAGSWGHSVVVAKPVDQVEPPPPLGKPNNTGSVETREIFSALRSARKAYSEFSNSPQGVYEKDDNIFVIVVIDTAREKLRHVEGTAMLRSVALLRRRFPDLPDEFTTFSRVLENEQKFDSDDYRYAVLYSRRDIDKLIAHEMSRLKAEEETKLAEQAAEKPKAEAKAIRAEQTPEPQIAEAEAKFSEQSAEGKKAEAVRTPINAVASVSAQPLDQSNSPPEQISAEMTEKPKKTSKGVVFVFENEFLE